MAADRSKTETLRFGHCGGAILFSLFCIFCVSAPYLRAQYLKWPQTSTGNSKMTRMCSLYMHVHISVYRQKDFVVELGITSSKAVTVLVLDLWKAHLSSVFRILGELVLIGSVAKREAFRRGPSLEGCWRSSSKSYSS